MNVTFQHLGSPIFQAPLNHQNWHSLLLSLTQVTAPKEPSQHVPYQTPRKVVLSLTSCQNHVTLWYILSRFICCVSQHSQKMIAKSPTIDRIYSRPRPRQLLCFPQFSFSFHAFQLPQSWWFRMSRIIRFLLDSLHYASKKQKKQTNVSEKYTMISNNSWNR